MKRFTNHNGTHVAFALLCALPLLTASCKGGKTSTPDSKCDSVEITAEADSQCQETSVASRFVQRAKDLLPTDKLGDYYEFMARHEEMAKVSQDLTTLVYFLEDDAMLHCKPSKLYETEVAWRSVMGKVCDLYYEEKAEGKNSTNAIVIAETVSDDLEHTFSYLASSTNSEMNLYGFIVKRMLMYRSLLASEHLQQEVRKGDRTKLQEELRQWVQLLAAIEEYVDKQDDIIYDGGSICASIYYNKCNDVLKSRLKWCSTADTNKLQDDISLANSITKLCQTLHANMATCKTNDGATPTKTKALSKATDRLKQQVRTWQTACRNVSSIGPRTYEHKMALLIRDIDNTLTINGRQAQVRDRSA